MNYAKALVSQASRWLDMPHSRYPCCTTSHAAIGRDGSLVRRAVHGICALVLCGLSASLLTAAEPARGTFDAARQYEDGLGPYSHAQPDTRVTSRHVADSSEPDYDPTVDHAPWGEPVGEWQDRWDEGCESCGSIGNCGCSLGGFWGQADALYWWVQGSETPPLVTTSPEGTPLSDAGVLPEAEILFGDQRLNRDGHGGGRFTFGYWLDACGAGIEDTFLFLGETTQSFYASSNGSLILARPFFNTETSVEDAFVLAYPDVTLGNVAVTSSSVVYGNEVNLRSAVYADCRMRVDCLVGYRLLYLAEGLTINTNSTALEGGSVPAGTNFVVQDVFDTRNYFNGGQVGLRMRDTYGPWLLDIVGKLAVGAVSQRVNINGSTVITDPDGASQTYSGGVLALDSNIGTYSQPRFSVLPEFAVNLGYRWTPSWKVNFGYTLLYLMNFARPGEQIDLQVDAAQFPPGTSGDFPVFVFGSADLWIQGLNFGVEHTF